MIPTLFSLGPIPVYSFGFMMVLAFLTAWRSLYLRIEAAEKDPALAERICFWAAIGGILGARLFYIASFPREFLADPLGAVFGGAGFVFYGGLIGGFIGVSILLKRSGHNLLEFADYISVPLTLGYAVGRIGCQLSGDGDYGIESTLPWAMSYIQGVVPTAPGVRVHPSPVYETLFALFSAIILIRMEQKGAASLKPGFIFGAYLLLASLGRFFVEFVRIEPRLLIGLTQAQIVSGLLFILGLALIAWKREH